MSEALRSRTRGVIPAASINCDLEGSINLLPLFLAPSYFSRAMGERWRNM